MRNFGDNFVFEKTTEVINTSAKRPAAALKVENPLSETSTQLNLNFQSAVKDPAVRFYPEGGSLIEGLSSKVAVKARTVLVGV